MGFPLRLPFGPLLALALIAGALAAPSTPAQSAPQAAAADRELAAAAVRWEAGARQEAVLELSGAAERSGSPERWRTLARWCFETHRLEQSLAALDRLGADPERLRGRLLVRLLRYEEGLALLGRDSELELLARLEALEALGRFEDWPAELEAGAKLLGPTHPELLRRQGRLDLEAGRLDAAIEAFERCLAQDATLAPALFGLGQALLRAGREQEGLEKLAQHRVLVPLLDELEFARRSLDLAPSHGPNWASLGDVQRRLGQPQVALASYARALSLTQGEERAPIVLRAARLEEEDLAQPTQALARLEAEWSLHGDLRVLVRASDVAARAGDLARALELIDLALARRPADAALLERRAKLRPAPPPPR
jgi:tetratricopeptide (TPR) repeat protein